MENNEKTPAFRLRIGIYTAQEKIPVFPDDMATQFLMKGVDWNDIALIQKGVLYKGDVNYRDPLNQNLTLIQRACKDKNAGVVAELLKAPNIDIHVYTPDTRPAFLLAATRKDEDGQKIVDLLIDHELVHNREIVNAYDPHGNRMLHMACIKGDIQAIKTLLNKGARTTLKNNRKQTPLAAGYLQNPNFKKIYSSDLKKLVSRDKQGNTQLHWAALIDDSINETFDDYIMFLVSQGLSLHKRNKKKMLPIDLVSNKYNVRYKQYMATTKPDHTYILLTQTEMILHSFLRSMYTVKPCALFREVLRKNELPKDLQAYIASIYYALNTETIIAKKYKNNLEYYGKTLEQKNEIKNKLLENPESHLLWNA
jgi:hypothetical protein